MQSKSCDKTFEKTCDLEFHVRENHDSVEMLQCEKCDKTFVLEWRFKEYQEIHTNKKIRKCHVVPLRKLGACLNICYLKNASMQRNAIQNCVLFNI